MINSLRVLFIGDVVGETGRTMFQKHIDALRTKYKLDAIIVNGENSSNRGRGITPKIMQFFKQHGVSVVTSGNHIWQEKDIIPYFASNTDLIRPANFPGGVPGSGVTTFVCQGFTVAVINLQGRVFMRENINCPFREAQSILTYLKHKTNIIFIDFHAEVTAEKQGLAYFLDGQVSGIVGTHTHVQTADERILPGGTAYITDLGYVGSLNSMLGMKKDPIIHNFLTQMPVKFEVETTSPAVLFGVIIDVDTATGKALAIERVKVVDSDITFQAKPEGT